VLLKIALNKIYQNKNNINMEQNSSMVSIPKIQISYATKILTKGIITGVLILFTLIPATVTLTSCMQKAIWKVAGVFALVLGLLYGFIFVLIQLEDTALLVGSIGLFAVLALVMYISRNINWYNPSLGNPSTEIV
jgi:hypothetical protein